MKEGRDEGSSMQVSDEHLPTEVTMQRTVVRDEFGRATCCTTRCAHSSKPATCRWRVFFFQAEDGIRDYKVTGVQTCALPIFSQWARHSRAHRAGSLWRWANGANARASTR